MLRIVSEAILCLMVLAMPLPSITHAAEDVPVVLVTEVKGKVDAVRTGKWEGVTTLMELALNTRVKLQAQARLVMLNYATGERYQVIGPALVKVGAEVPEGLSGSEPVKLAVRHGKDGRALRINPVGVRQAAIVPRGAEHKIELLAPKGQRVTGVRPYFQWKSDESGVNYQFVLKDDTGRIVHETGTQEKRLELPASVGLEPNVLYRWSVTVVTSSGTSYSASRKLALVDVNTRRDMENFQPTPGASVDMRVTYALWLDQENLNDESEALWLALESEGVARRP